MQGQVVPWKRHSNMKATKAHSEVQQNNKTYQTQPNETEILLQHTWQLERESLT